VNDDTHRRGAKRPHPAPHGHCGCPLNLSYFGIEFAVGLAIGSVSLFADSVDFLEDASINLMIAIGLGWSQRQRARLGMLLATILLVPALAGLWTAWHKLTRWRLRPPYP
jgi:Co/Zn/Cd efflux system component